MTHYYMHADSPPEWQRYWLYVLTLPANIDAALGRLQHTLWREWGGSLIHLLPPCIPLQWVAEPPSRPQLMARSFNESLKCKGWQWVNNELLLVTNPHPLYASITAMGTTGTSTVGTSTVGTSTVGTSTVGTSTVGTSTVGTSATEQHGVPPIPFALKRGVHLVFRHNLTPADKDKVIAGLDVLPVRSITAVRLVLLCIDCPRQWQSAIQWSESYSRWIKMRP